MNPDFVLGFSVGAFLCFVVIYLLAIAFGSTHRQKSEDEMMDKINTYLTIKIEKLKQEKNNG